MDTAPANDILRPSKQERIVARRQRIAIAFAFSILIGMGVLAAVMATTHNVSAQAAPKSQGSGAPPIAGAPGSPDCNAIWSVVSSPDPGTGNNYLTGVAAISASDVWAVGEYYDNIPGDETPLLLHWNGTVWSRHEVSLTGRLEGVTALSIDNVWAVGYSVSSGVEQGLILHWDGSAWIRVSGPNGSHFNGVAAVSANNVWAVGYSGNQGLTLIKHWDGSSWSNMSSPNPSTTHNELTGIAAVSSHDVWAVGDYEASSNFYKTLALHWDGSAWVHVSSPNIGSNWNGLLGVTATSSSNAWALAEHGSGGMNTSTILHWDGNTWSQVSYPYPGTYAILSGISAVSASDVWAVGQYASGALVEHWDGTSWSLVSSPTTYRYLFGVDGVSANVAWAVGIYQAPAQSAQTLVEQYGCPPPPTNTPVPLPSQCPIQFEDVPNPSAFYPYTQCLACRGIVSGFACGGTNEPCDLNHDPYFRPHNDISRGQLAKIVALSAQINTPVSGQSFQDVAPGSAFYTYTEQLHALGAMGGYACGGTNEPCVPPANLPYFRPHNSATRGQLAKIDSETAGYTDPPSGQQFQDVAIGSTYYSYTYRLAHRSIMSGYTCGGANEPCVPPANLPYFRPNNNVTRGQTSKIVANTFYPNCQAP